MKLWNDWQLGIDSDGSSAASTPLVFSEDDDDADSTMAASTQQPSSEATTPAKGEWWLRPGIYRNDAVRPGVISELMRHSTHGRVLAPAEAKLSMFRRYRKSRAAQRAKKSGLAAAPQEKETKAKQKKPTRVVTRGKLGKGTARFGMYVAARKEAGLASSVDAEAQEVLDKVAMSDAVGSFSQSDPMGLSTNQGCSPLAAILSGSATRTSGRLSGTMIPAATPVSPVGKQNLFAPDSDDEEDEADVDRLSGAATSNQSPVDDKTQWDRLIRRSSTGVPVITQLGKRAGGMRARNLTSIVTTQGTLSPYSPASPDNSMSGGASAGSGGAMFGGEMAAVPFGAEPLDDTHIEATISALLSQCD